MVSSHLVWTVLGCVQLGYCIFHVLAKNALMAGTHPLILAFYREMIACVCMYTLAYKIDGKSVWSGFQRCEIGTFLLLGFLSYGNVVGFIVALEYVTAFNSALLHPSIPVFTAFFAVLVGMETMTRRKALGIFLSLFGAVVVVAWGTADGSETGEAGANDKHVVLGNFLLLGQCASMAALLVVQKAPLSRGVPPTTLTARYYSVSSVLTILTTLLVLLPFGDFAGEGGKSNASPLKPYEIGRSPAALVAIVYGGTVSVTFTYCALAWATKHGTPSMTALSMTLQPPLNALLSIIFMNRKTFTAGEVVGGTLVLLGLVVTVMAQPAVEERVGDGHRLIDGQEETGRSEGEAFPGWVSNPICGDESSVAGVAEDGVTCPANANQTGSESGGVEGNEQNTFADTDFTNYDDGDANTSIQLVSASAVPDGVSIRHVGSATRLACRDPGTFLSI
mmetsp:Transcript_46761/g.94322  ORF Transcript_46761/g.94322 Transcript_46761/m.94322 type:complete len:449 (-) Transcript_46761:9-1355(-)